MDQLTIGETARRAGVRPSALRYYESVGLLDAPRRISGRRRYDSQVLNRLSVIRLAQDAGFTIAEIRHCCSVSSRPPRRLSVGRRWHSRSSPKSML